jgi:hypothetical protein
MQNGQKKYNTTFLSAEGIEQQRKALLPIYYRWRQAHGAYDNENHLKVKNVGFIHVHHSNQNLIGVENRLFSSFVF